MVNNETDLKPSSKKRKRNFNILITFNENHKPQYNGRVKLTINSVSTALFIEPKNEYFMNITAIFDWKFIQSKNILFVFASHVSQDFVLVFKNEETCTIVCNKIFQNRDVDFVEKELLNERFLNLLFKNTSRSLRLKEILKEWIQKFDEEEKNEYLNLLKWHQDNPEISDYEKDIKDIKPEIKPLPKKNRKRRHHEIDTTLTGLSDSANSQADGHDGVDDESQECSSKKQNSNRFTNVIDKTKFDIVNFRTAYGFRRKLLIFTSPDKTHCYEYSYCNNQIFKHRCVRGMVGMKAILGRDEDGNECIKMEDKKHRCSPIFYEPEKYIELKIVRKPNYEMLINCATQSGKMLIIFNLNDRSQCYEYYWNSKLKSFGCNGCASNGITNVSAQICHEDTDIEYAILSNKKHHCEMRKYNSAKYFSFKKHLLSPDFEIQMTFKRNGIERKSLIVFDETDRKKCYVYYCCNNSNLFRCNGCNRKRQQNVSAELRKNAENEEYVIFSKNKHICSPENYIPPKEIITLRLPKFKFIDATETLKSKLIIFHPTNSELCYVFSHVLDEKRYYCLACDAELQQRNKMNKNQSPQMKQVPTVFLGKDDGPDGDYFIKFYDGENHICQPQKYSPEKYEIKILKPKIDYIMLRDNRKNMCLVIYHPNDKNLCFKYIQNKPTKSFQCRSCQKLKTCITAKLQQDLDGNEYFTVNENQHACSPIKYSSVAKQYKEILEKSGLTFEEHKKKDVDESRIVRLPNFELQRNSKGIPERRLMIFIDNDRKLCYNYKFCKSRDSFVCKECKAYAKVRNMEEENSDEKYIFLCEKKHTCQPVEYKPEKEIIESNGPENDGTVLFSIFNRENASKPTKLVVFTSTTKEFCYEYTFHNYTKVFRCCGCKSLKKIISAKVLSENGKENIQLLNEHVCTPKKFILEEFQPKIIPESGFKLFANKNGKPNSKLIIFDPEKDGFGYNYSLKNSNYFICLQCNPKKTYVSAKLFEKENGEKFLEISSTLHVCESKKLEPSEIK